jgi:hypothetical protein
MKKATKKTVKKVAKKAAKPEKPSNPKKSKMQTAVVNEVDFVEQNNLQNEADKIQAEVKMPMASKCRILITKMKNQDPLIRVGVVWALTKRKRIIGSDFYQPGEELEHVKGYAQKEFKAVSQENCEKVIKAAIISTLKSYNGVSTSRDYYIE